MSLRRRHRPLWVVPSYTITSEDESAIWKAIRREYEAFTGPGPFIVTIDGRSGSGKSRLAERLLDRARADVSPKSELFHLEDLYPGWEGLAAGVDHYAAMLNQLLTGHDAAWNAWDWTRGQAEEAQRTVSASVPLLIAEGVGASAPGHPEVSGHFGLWLHVETPVRRFRALRRDGDLYRPYWALWADQEAKLFDS
ncbi:hypothetical protein [uncultured Kocuria sp.]|uniref:hypothetical protein n=1 Tax=uncultured Kocuria sp. TaxID=259305 RepID=UPI002599ECD6|nr:hypothetical protein [uncultured Kocuria sp.]MCT1368184.1 hypothetical protein [Rothia sp. p3-SID1597]